MIRTAGRIALAVAAAGAFAGVLAGLALLGWAFGKQDAATKARPPDRVRAN